MITGIIAEFNPFHNGHAYLLKKAQGLKIVVMSGNFVQRGEPALVDKWVRTQMALENGADLVVELPFLAAVQSADYFAQGAIDILARLGMDSLTFGTEEFIDYNALAQLYASKEKEMSDFLIQQASHLTYPQKTQAMWQTFAGLEVTGQTPNHILALAYVKAAAGYGIRLNPIKRQGAGFHSTEKTTAYASATAIRQHLSDREFVENASPSSSLILSSPRVSWQDYFPLLKYRIISQPDLTSIYQVNEELAHRLKAVINSVDTVEDLLDKVATKRYTKARIRRILTYILVNAREEELPTSIHVLGFSQKGQEYLKTIKKDCDLTTKIGKKTWDSMTQQSDDIYILGNKALKNQTYGRVPLRY